MRPQNSGLLTSVVTSRPQTVKAGIRLLMAALYDGNEDRIFTVNAYNSDAYKISRSKRYDASTWVCATKKIPASDRSTNFLRKRRNSEAGD